MRTGIISCQADTGLRAIAELMASYHVHAVVVERAGVESGQAPGPGWGIVSDVVLARAGEAVFLSLAPSVTHLRAWQ